MGFLPLNGCVPLCDYKLELYVHARHWLIIHKPISDFFFVFPQNKMQTEKSDVKMWLCLGGGLGLGLGLGRGRGRGLGLGLKLGLGRGLGLGLLVLVLVLVLVVVFVFFFVLVLVLVVVLVLVMVVSLVMVTWPCPLFFCLFLLVLCVIALTLVFAFQPGAFWCQRWPPEMSVSYNMLSCTALCRLVLPWGLALSCLVCYFLCLSVFVGLVRVRVRVRVRVSLW